MGVIIDFVVGLAIIALIVNFLLRGMRQRVSDERDTVISRRVEAYMATIRREGRNPELAAMSDEELRDLLLSSARNLKIENDRRWYALSAAGVVGVIVPLLVATQDGLRGFGIALVVAAIVLFAINEIFVRKSREPLMAQGIDVERLRVE